MTDNEVYRAIRHQLLKQLAEAGIAISVVAGFQSTKQGREDSFVMFFPIEEAAHGWQGRNYHVVGRDANHRETQLVEKTLQVQGVGTHQDLNASDITATVRMIVNSLPFVDALRKKNIGVQRAGNLRTPFFVNDQGNYELSPSFDVKITHSRDIKPNTAAISGLYPDIYRI
ncbi:phage gateway protein [Xenorhabdus szentirmaii]|uniref:Phage related-protein n=1 Tax=Xenorhabdus szentirmaii DSM 16338 TaxID=1427518 RepID=W1J6K0_9GAMM|nr:MULTISPECIES: hypothetical protein [Xenorhabdus]MBD2779908.1 hypothetical protein [Xenorhabdus sp. 38]MBD2822495.1 hypothetical protein [Xenorhabdus sp. 42]PHM32135.1 phage related-protein [Xenorhabdus szentirmaii DSM 16338]PHM41573.1 phage related-protein [Xenorhabdus szentirmaii]CDL85471.1 conserved hypothetical protein [Xenorhabdus szentirmaii DSM 16338]